MFEHYIGVDLHQAFFQARAANDPDDPNLTTRRCARVR